MNHKSQSVFACPPFRDNHAAPPELTRTSQHTFSASAFLHRFLSLAKLAFGEEEKQGFQFVRCAAGLTEILVIPVIVLML